VAETSGTAGVAEGHDGAPGATHGERIAGHQAHPLPKDHAFIDKNKAFRAMMRRTKQIGASMAKHRNEHSASRKRILKKKLKAQERK
jgi:hypothetical protein